MGVKSREPYVDRASHFRMNDGLEGLAGGRVRKYDIGQFPPIEGPVRLEHVRTEFLDHGGEARGSRCHGLASQDVGIDRGDAELLESRSNMALPRGNSAC